MLKFYWKAHLETNYGDYGVYLSSVYKHYRLYMDVECPHCKAVFRLVGLPDTVREIPTATCPACKSMAMLDTAALPKDKPRERVV